MYQVEWIKAEAGNWLALNTISNLQDVKTFGVYVIWHVGNPGRVVRVGQGDIEDRLSCHQGDQEVQNYARDGELLVTWAACTAAQADGIERYLADRWSPLVGDRWPNALPIAVNDPW
jgi:hypothetical protein